jgi:hypothetical protein
MRVLPGTVGYPYLRYRHLRSRALLWQLKRKKQIVVTDYKTVGEPHGFHKNPKNGMVRFFWFSQKPGGWNLKNSNFEIV